MTIRDQCDVVHLERDVWKPLCGANKWLVAMRADRGAVINCIQCLARQWRREADEEKQRHA